MFRILISLASFALLGCAIFLSDPPRPSPELRAWTAPRWFGYTDTDSLRVQLFFRVNHCPDELTAIVQWGDKVLPYTPRTDHSWHVDVKRAGLGRHTIRIWILRETEVMFYRELWLWVVPKREGERGPGLIS